jgi:hypothetical protein
MNSSKSEGKTFNLYMDALCKMLRELEIPYVVDNIPTIYITDFYKKDTCILLSPNLSHAYDPWGNFLLTVYEYDVENDEIENEPYIRITTNGVDDLRRIFEGWK